MKSDQGLPLLVGEFVGRRGLLLVGLDALPFHHYQARIDYWAIELVKSPCLVVEESRENLPLTSLTNCSWVNGRVSGWGTILSCSKQVLSGDDGGELARSPERRVTPTWNPCPVKLSWQSSQTFAIVRSWFVEEARGRSNCAEREIACGSERI